MAVIGRRTNSAMMAGAKAMMVENVKNQMRNGVAHFDTCQNIQKLVHPRGIYRDNEKKRYLTIEDNEVFGLFHSISSDYETATNEKQDKSFDLSCFVARGGPEPPTS